MKWNLDPEESGNSLRSWERVEFLKNPISHFSHCLPLTLRISWSRTRVALDSLEYRSKTKGLDAFSLFQWRDATNRMSTSWKPEASVFRANGMGNGFVINSYCALSFKRGRVRSQKSLIFINQVTIRMYSRANLIIALTVNFCLAHVSNTYVDCNMQLLQTILLVFEKLQFWINWSEVN